MLALSTIRPEQHQCFAMIVQRLTDIDLDKGKERSDEG